MLSNYLIYNFTNNGKLCTNIRIVNETKTDLMVSRGARTALAIAPAKAPLRNSPTSLVFKKSWKTLKCALRTQNRTYDFFLHLFHPNKKKKKIMQISFSSDNFEHFHLSPSHIKKYLLKSHKNHQNCSFLFTIICHGLWLLYFHRDKRLSYSCSSVYQNREKSFLLLLSNVT